MTRLAFGLIASLAISSSAFAAADILDIKTLDDLQKAPAIKVAGDWEIQVGLGGGGEEGATWRLLYCRAKYTGAEKEPKTGAGQVRMEGPAVEALGPVFYRITPLAPAAMKDIAEMAWKDAPLPRDAIYAATIAAAARSRLRIEVVAPDGKTVLATRDLAVDKPPIHRWYEFAEDRGVRGEGMPWCKVQSEPPPAMPTLSGLAPVEDLSERQVKLDEEAGIPGMTPRKWPSISCPGVEIKKGAGPAYDLRLSLKDGAFVIESDVPMITWPDLHLLARWWVNGEPMPKEMKELGRRPIRLGRLVSVGKTMSVAFGLPADLGDLKPGDKVALQVLYSPAMVEGVSPDGMMARAISNDRESSPVPLLSNKLEFAVTAAMLNPGPAAIPDVKTLDDLRQSEPITVGDWEVRLGLSDAGEDVRSWKMAYCLAKYVGKDGGERATLSTAGDDDPERWALGPVSIRLRPDEDEAQAKPRHRDELACVVPREGLYAAVAPLAGEGKFVLEALNDEGQVIAERRITVGRDAGHAWMKFARERRAKVKDEPPFTVEPAARGKLWPKVVGFQPALEGDALKQAALKPLPAGLAPGGLELKLEGGAFVVRAPEPVEWSARKLLARWWVNGRHPPEAPGQNEVQDDTMEKPLEFARTKETRVRFSLPAYLGELKAGDRVAVQVAWSPDEIQYVAPPGDEVKRLARMKRDIVRNDVKVPLLSNRIEFEVTEEMRKARGAP